MIDDINYLVAIHVMDWAHRTQSGSDGYWTGEHWRFRGEWDPGGNLLHAWKVVDHLRGSWDFYLSGESSCVTRPRWRASVTPIHNGEGMCGPCAPSPSLAICLLALKVRGVT